MRIRTSCNKTGVHIRRIDTRGVDAQMNDHLKKAAIGQPFASQGRRQPEKVTLPAP